MKLIPASVAKVVNEVLTGSHASLNAQFQQAGAPGDPPQLSHASKWKIWLLAANNNPDVEPLSVLGRVLEEFMEVEPPETETIGEVLGISGTLQSQWLAKKLRVEKALEAHGLRYARGGKIVETGHSDSSAAFASALRSGNLDEVEIELDRALKSVSQDPSAAITAGCSLLEALFKAYIQNRGLDLPNKETLKPLWSVVQKDIGLDPKNQTDDDIQRILQGLSSIVDGIAALRTHGGSAHGGGGLRYKMKERHARLAIGSAQVLAHFIIDTKNAKSEQKAR